MIIRGTPKNKENYIIVDSYTSNILCENNFCPKYIDNEYVYFVRNIDIINFIIKGGLKCKTV